MKDRKISPAEEGILAARRERLGTPRTIYEAMQQAFAIGPMSDLKKRIEASHRDFLAQKFTVANIRMAQWRDGSSTAMTPEDIIIKLFEELTTEYK